MRRLAEAGEEMGEIWSVLGASDVFGCICMGLFSATNDSLPVPKVVDVVDHIPYPNAIIIHAAAAQRHRGTMRRVLRVGGSAVTTRVGS